MTSSPRALISNRRRSSARIDMVCFRWRFNRPGERWRGGRRIHGQSCRSTGSASRDRCARAPSGIPSASIRVLSTSCTAAAIRRGRGRGLPTSSSRPSPPCKSLGGRTASRCSTAKSAGRRPVRGADQRSVRGRVDVPPAPRRLESRPDFLVELMRESGMTLLDVQWRTDHLESLGAVEIDRERYLGMLAEAIATRGTPGR